MHGQQQKQQQQQQQEQRGGGISCTAHNRDTCSVHCPSGNCYAIYHEPNGPCKASCVKAEGTQLMLSKEFSIQITVKRASLLAHALADQIPENLRLTLEANDGPLTVTGKFLKEQFIVELYRLLGGSSESETEA